VGTLAATGAIFAVLGALFGVLGYRIARAGRSFDRRAVRAPGEITDVHWRSIGPASGTTLTGFPVLRFTLPDGRVVETESRTGTTADVRKEGEAVTVLYDPADPGQARVDSASSTAASPLAGALFMVMGGAFVLLGLALIVAGIALDDALTAVISP